MYARIHVCWATQSCLILCNPVDWSLPGSSVHGSLQARIHRRTIQKVKGALGGITINKASGGDEIPAELFQILKDDAGKVLHSICQQIWEIHPWPQDWKRSIVFIPISKKGSVKECSNYHTTVLISHAIKVILKILQARLQQYVNWVLSRCTIWI